MSLGIVFSSSVTTFKDWWGMNWLWLANGKDSTKMVSNQNPLSCQKFHALKCSVCMTIEYWYAYKPLLDHSSR
jgi:hypothetical protein